MKILKVEWNLICVTVWCLNLAGKILGHRVNENLVFRVLKPSHINYDFTIRPAKNFGGTFNFVYNGIQLVAADPIEACGEIQNADEVRGAVALVKRGECSFLSKSIVADRAGALMVIIFDYDKKNDNRFIDMIDDDTRRPTTIPTAFMQGRDGFWLEQYLTVDKEIIEIAIPVNTTGIPYSHLHRPPWTLW
nr:protease-associated domain-containing protein 1-like [Lytechinus pictus]